MELMKPATSTFTKVAVVLHNNDDVLDTELGVDEVYVYSNHSDKVKSGKILPLNSMCVGDIFRHLDTSGIIKNDFLFLSSTVAHEIDLKELYNKHIEDKKKKPQLLMTILLSNQEKGGIYIHQNNMLLFYSPQCDYIPLNCKESEFTLQNNIKHCLAMICSADVPLLFTENFDYQTLDDFIKGILESELLDKEFQIVLPESFCMENTTLKADYAISKYKKRKDAKRLATYLQPTIINSSIAPLTSIDFHSVIESSSIQSNSTIHDSFIKSSTIGRSCTIISSVIEAGCQIADNCRIEHSIIKCNSTVKANIIESIVPLDSTIEEPLDTRTSSELAIYQSIKSKLKKGESTTKILHDDVEIKDTIYRLINDDKNSIENVKIELRTLRMSLHASFDKMRNGILSTLSPKCFIDDRYLHLLVLLKDFTHSNEDEFHILLVLLNDMNKNQISLAKLKQVVELLWDSDVLNNSLFEWIELKTTGENGLQLIQKTENDSFYSQALGIVKQWEAESSDGESSGDSDDSQSSEE